MMAATIVSTLLFVCLLIVVSHLLFVSVIFGQAAPPDTRNDHNIAGVARLQATREGTSDGNEVHRVKNPTTQSQYKADGTGISRVTTKMLFCSGVCDSDPTDYDVVVAHDARMMTVYQNLGNGFFDIKKTNQAFAEATTDPEESKNAILRGSQMEAANSKLRHDTLIAFAAQRL